MNVFAKTVIESRWLGLVLIVLVTFGLYAVVLPAPFRGMDDATMIVDNEAIRSFDRLPEIFTSSFFGDRSYYRPLVTASYMLEYHWFGLKAFFYNLDNLVLHLLNALSVFFLILRLTGDRRTAWWVSFLFAVHPLQWEAVANVSGRVILLATFFSLHSLSWFIDFCRSRRMICLTGSLLSFTLALLCKESAAMLPAVLVAYLVCLQRQERARPWMSLAPFVLLVGAMLALRRQLGITELFGWGSWSAALLGFMTFANGVLTYLRLLVFPVDLYFDRSQAVFRSFGDVQLVATAVFWLAAFGLLWRVRARLSSMIVFCLVWCALELAPVSQIVTSIGVQPGFISLAEHFLYLPMVPLLTIVVIAGQRLAAVNAQRRWVSASVGSWVLAGLVGFLCLTTLQQNLYAFSERMMLLRSLEHQPMNSRVQYSMGMYYVKLGLFKPAEQYFLRAVAVDPGNVRARIALGKSLCDQGRYEEGLAVYATIGDAGPLRNLLEENIRLTREIIRQQKP